MKPAYDFTRPLSWSSINLFEEDSEKWYRKYILGEEIKFDYELEMKFGKKIGEKLANNPKFLPDVPRGSIFEHKFEGVYAGVPLIGYADSIDIVNDYLLEYKTGRSIWDQKRVDTHGQLDLYALLHYLKTKVKPEQMLIRLVWLPTEGGKMQPNWTMSPIKLVRPIVPRIFETKRTMAQALAVGERAVRAFKGMKEYYKNHK